MPRIRKSDLYLDGFDSLSELDSAVLTPDARALAVPCPELPSPRKSVLICHDNSGRAPATDSERRWTFEHWERATDFCFHRRVTVPPPAVTIAAHRTGTRSLGTLIFEGAVGAEDALKLVTKPSGFGGMLRLRSGPRGDPFDTLGTHYIDRLIELCLAKGFDGYLLNFEIDLGIRDGVQGQEPKRRFAREHALALLAWVETFRIEVEKRVPQGYVVWYDSLTVEGDLRWQCRLTPLNIPYALAAGNCFLDYHWVPQSLEDLPVVVRNIAKSADHSNVLRRKELKQRPLDVRDIFVGIDVYGRGMPGGGGFDTHIALDYITRSSKELSIAFFAPAWTRDELSGQKGEPWSVFEVDDAFLWRGGSIVPASVARERERKDTEDERLRREQELPPRTEPFPPFRPISDFVPVKQMPTTSSFFTCFARSSSDLAFRIEGTDAVAGPWTDPAAATPAADQVSPFHKHVRLTNETSWMAGHSLVIDSAASVALCTVNLVLQGKCEASVIWHSTSDDGPALLLDGTEMQGNVTTRALTAGWRQTVYSFEYAEETHVRRLGISARAAIHIGTIAAGSANIDQYFIEQPRWHTEDKRLSWRFSETALWYAVESDQGMVGTTAHPTCFGELDAPVKTMRIGALTTCGILHWSEWTAVEERVQFASLLDISLSVDSLLLFRRCEVHYLLKMLDVREALVVSGVLLLCAVLKWPTVAIGTSVRKDLPTLAKPAQKFPWTIRWMLGLPLLGETLGVLKLVHRMLEWMLLFAEETGDVCSITIAGKRFIILANPKAIEHCQKTNMPNYEKGWLQLSPMADVLGHGIFASDGEQWISQRKATSRIFSAGAFRGIIGRSVEEHLDTFVNVLSKKADLGVEVPLSDKFFAYTLDSFTYMVFGVELSALTKEQPVPFQVAFDYAQARVNSRIFNPGWQIYEPLSFLGVKMSRAKTVIDAFTYEVIDERDRMDKAGEISQEKGAVDLLSIYRSIRDHNGQGMSRKDLRDATLNLLIAGRDTTAQALSWTFYYICNNPKLLDPIREEADRVLGEGQKVNYDNHKQLVQANALFHEVLRLHPSVPKNGKTVVADDVLPGNITVRAGDIVAWSDWAIARRTQVWGEDAKEMKPSRWIDEEGNLKRFSEYHYRAFNAGPRLCLGQNLAIFNGVAVIVALARNFDFSFAPGYLETVPMATGIVDAGPIPTPLYVNSLTLPMLEPLRVKLQRRKVA